MDKVLADAKGQITLVLDGWSNIRNEAIINYVAVTRRHAIFLKTEATGADRHTGENITQGLINTVDELGGAGAVVAVTTDNASNMKSSWPALEQRFPGLLALGCASHTVNLTVEDLFKTTQISTIFYQALTVAKYFKRSYILLALLDKSAQRNRIKRYALLLPGATRWQGKLNTSRSVLNNRALLEDVIDNQDQCLGPRPTSDVKIRF